MKKNDADELIIANREIAFQQQKKEDRAAELIIANKGSTFLRSNPQRSPSKIACLVF